EAQGAQMRIHNDLHKPSRFAFSFLAGILFIAIAIHQSFQNTQAADAESSTATYSKGTLHVTIPYQAPDAGAGQLTVEVLDPEDAVVGRAEGYLDVRAGKGQWQENLTLTKAVSVDDLVWHR